MWGHLWEEPWIFRIFPVIFAIVFLGILGVFVFIGLRGFKGWLYNNRQQVYNDPVRVADKRTHVWGGGTHHASANTSYYITFEFENGERQEFMVPDRVYGQTASGDTGTLTWQGTRFHDFQRVKL